MCRIDGTLDALYVKSGEPTSNEQVSGKHPQLLWSNLDISHAPDARSCNNGWINRHIPKLIRGTQVWFALDHDSRSLPPALSRTFSPFLNQEPGHILIHLTVRPAAIDSMIARYCGDQSDVAVYRIVHTYL